MKMRISLGVRASFLFLFLLTAGSSIFAQTRTITGPGTWSNTGIWSGGLIADEIGENADFSNNIGEVTVDADFTIGSVTMGNGNTITINSGFSLNLGQAGTPKSMTIGNTGTINVIGTLIIW